MELNFQLELFLAAWVTDDGGWTTSVCLCRDMPHFTADDKKEKKPNLFNENHLQRQKWPHLLWPLILHWHSSAAGDEAAPHSFAGLLTKWPHRTRTCRHASGLPHRAGQREHQVLSYQRCVWYPPSPDYPAPPPEANADTQLKAYTSAVKLQEQKTVWVKGSRLLNFYIYLHIYSDKVKATE